jgi:hypothetical protein
VIGPRIRPEALQTTTSGGPPSTASIASNSRATCAGSLASAAATGAPDLYKIYASANRDGIDFTVTWIPQSFDMTPLEVFDPNCSRAVYDLGYEIGLAGGAWRSHPPFFSHRSLRRRTGSDRRSPGFGRSRGG